MQPISPVIPGIPPVYEVIYAKDQPQFSPLPAYKWKDGHVVSRWKMSFKERLHCLFFGYIYLNIFTYNEPLQPIKLSIDPPEETRGY